MLVSMGNNKNSHTLTVEFKMVQTVWKIVWQFIKKLNTEARDPAIPLLEETNAHRKTCTQILIVA